MGSSEHARRWRRWLLLCLAGVLGAAVVVMPALASSEGGPIEARGSGYSFEWSPMSVTVNSGAPVTIKNPSGLIAHGVKWNVVPATPSCKGVPGTAGEPESATGWSGTCTFAKAGEYTFYCTVHGPAMSGKVIVNAAGETTVTTTTSTPGSPPPPPGGGGTTPNPGEPGAPQPSAGAAGPSLLASSASSAVKVPASQRGHAVHGSVAVSQAGEGARLEVDLLARSAVLAGAGHNSLLRIGRVVVAHVHAGAVKFSVALSRAARKALARRRRLSVTVHITLRSPGAAPLTIKRSVLLRP